jgi:hypothetical protein
VVYAIKLVFQFSFFFTDRKTEVYSRDVGRSKACVQMQSLNIKSNVSLILFISSVDYILLLWSTAYWFWMLFTERCSGKYEYCVSQNCMMVAVPDLF